MSAQGTLAEQLLGARAGEHVVRQVDLTFSHDATTPLAIQAFQEVFDGADQTPAIRHPDRVGIVFDHAYPAPKVRYAEHQQQIRRFIQEQGIEHFYPGQGICHLVLPEHGHITTGDVVLGADSHTCTLGPLGCFATGVGSTDVAISWATGSTWFRVPESLRIELTGELAGAATAKDVCLELARRIGQDGATYLAMEFGGPGWHALGMDARFTLANMTVDLGAKTATCETDQATLDWLERHDAAPGRRLEPGPEASYVDTVELDLSTVEPLVSGPHHLTRLRGISELAGLAMDRVVIGSCTNARVEDLAAAADVLDGHQVAIETLVVPGSERIRREAEAAGILDRLRRAGCTLLASGCGPCLGRHQGVLAPGERCLTTHNRNPAGRMGSPEAEIYLASPVVAAATAVAGEIAGPDRLAPVPVAGGGA